RRAGASRARALAVRDQAAGRQAQTRLARLLWAARPALSQRSPFLAPPLQLRLRAPLPAPCAVESLARARSIPCATADAAHDPASETRSESKPAGRPSCRSCRRLAIRGRLKESWQFFGNFGSARPARG